MFFHEDATPHEHLTDEQKRVLAAAVWRLDNVEFTTVGIDIGSSTSHLMFSRVHLRRQAHHLSSRFVVVERSTLWSSPIRFTPFLADQTIDTAALAAFIDEAFVASGIARASVDTGAVILTGEAVKRTNAAAIAALFAAEAGKFVCASAGHHLEAGLAAHGSGAAALSAAIGRTVLNVDIGGGTTKLGLCVAGNVVSTCAFEVGGRLIAYDAAGRLTRIDEPARVVAAAAGAQLELGVVPAPGALDRVLDAFARVALGFLQRETPSELGRALLLTDVLAGPPADIVTFSGGVSEYIYGHETAEFGDIARPLAERMAVVVATLGVEVTDLGAGIRATAVGVSQFTVQVSGRTLHLGAVELPLYNLPVVAPATPRGALVDAAAVTAGIGAALVRLDLEPSAPLALALRFEGSPTYARLHPLAQGIADAFAATGDAPLAIMLDGDVALSLGRMLEREFQLERPLVCIDGLELKDFDYVDIGRPIDLARGLPVIVKSLIFGR